MINEISKVSIAIAGLFSELQKATGDMDPIVSVVVTKQTMMGLSRLSKQMGVELDVDLVSTPGVRTTIMGVKFEVGNHSEA